MDREHRNGTDERGAGTTDGRIEQAKDAALGAHRGEATLGDEIGEAAGGISGALLGAGIGSAAGPVGTLIGGVAGAIGGWWTGRAIAEAAEVLSEDDDQYYRAHYTSSPHRLADRDYENVRAAYYLGDIASHNPNFTSRMFDEVEPELRRGWEAEPHTARHGAWEAVRPFANAGFERGSERRRRPRGNVQARGEDR